MILVTLQVWLEMGAEDLLSVVSAGRAGWLLHDHPQVPLTQESSADIS